MTIALSTANFVRARRLQYQEQDSRQTLGEGLAEYYRENAGRVLKPDQLTPESRELFRRHDMCHVIFGLDTTLEDEAMADKVQSVQICPMACNCFRRSDRKLALTDLRATLPSQSELDHAVALFMHATLPSIRIGRRIRLPAKGLREFIDRLLAPEPRQ